MPVSRELFRAISSSFPTGVVIVATLDEQGEPKGLTSQAYVGLSMEPPLMLVSIDRTSRTLPALQKHRAFVINFLREGAEDVATLFASKADDKFRNLRWEPSPEAGGAPILRGLSLAYAACRVTQMHEGGDHVMFVGSVEAGETLGGTPLMYYKRRYAAWPEERPAPPVEGAV
ncbi:MAG TPA: flavin reductase family protein [Candidatus Bathyarchaeia archaeon]|nr:flavin reductase family protein [Candidatus Bathyarchaeia archaeon]